MKFTYFTLLCILFLSSCNEHKSLPKVSKYDESTAIKQQQKHQNPRMRFTSIQSKFIDLNAIFSPFQEELASFSIADYERLKPTILEKSIPELQKYIATNKLTYESLVKFYLYRIWKFEKDSTTSLQAIIALNPNVINEAKEKDINRKHSDMQSPLYGMPILLKDNIDFIGMPTTAGAAVLASNYPSENAFIVDKLLSKGALILGKANLSEWAYFFCEGCPLGYSAIGGQTLNPYGRKVFETGGSSSGSGAAVAANYAVAAIGTETSGSITSPSSQNSVVGLKPGPGVLSRSGIVPISSTLDTPGPMTKFVVDNLILLNGMLGQDKNDAKSTTYNNTVINTISLDNIVTTFNGRKVGVFSNLYTDSIYKETIDKIISSGAVAVNLQPEEMSYNGFLNLLTTDMRNDLPKYLKTMSVDATSIQNTEQIVAFNKKDSVKRMPYGQKLLYGIVKDTTTEASLHKLKNTLRKNAQNYLGSLSKKSVSVILSINNYHSGVAALAGYPTLTIPMGYRFTGEPVSLTLIGLPNSESELLSMGLIFERQTKIRKAPINYN